MANVFWNERKEKFQCMECGELNPICFFCNKPIGATIRAKCDPIGNVHVCSLCREKIKKSMEKISYY